MERGVTYQPIPFDDYKDIKSHKSKAVADDHTHILNQLYRVNFEPKTILDLGCNVGFHTFHLSQRFGAEATGVEAEAKTCAVAQELAKEKGIGQVEFVCKPAQEYLRGNDSKFDLCIFINAHMWVHKQGPQYASEVLNWVKDHTKFCVFQTAHAQSAAMYTIKSLRDLGSVQKYLEGFGFKVELINVSMLHGGKPRGMFWLTS